jgi:peptide/nickel transport system substrate-binding protein
MPTLRLLAPVLAAGLIASGCGSAGGERGTEPATDSTFTMAHHTDPGSMDPYRSQKWFNLAYLAYDSLVNLQKDGTFASGLAEKWKVDARSATFTLREGVTCSDGHALTPADVAAAITFVSDPKNESSQYGVNVPTAPLTVSSDGSARTVTVIMRSEPFGFLLHTVGQLPIVCPAGLRNPDQLKTASSGTGPFVLTEVVAEQSYTFVRRDGYAWGPNGASTNAPGTPGKVVLKVVANESTAANLLLSGELNYARIIGDDGARLDGQGLDRLRVPAAGAWLQINERGGRPTADLRVRRALVQALDLEEVVRVSTGGAGTTATGLVALQPKPCQGDTLRGQLPGQDVAAAEQALDQAGWLKGADGLRSKGGKPLKLDLHYAATASTFEKPTAELLAKRWQAVGAKVALFGDAAATLTQTLYTTGNFDVYLGAAGFTLPSQAIPYFSGAVPPAGVNLLGLRNTRYEALVAKAATSTPPGSCSYWNQAEQALWQGLNPVPISDRPASYFLNKASAEIAGLNVPVPTSLRVLK